MGFKNLTAGLLSVVLGAFGPVSVASTVCAVGGAAEMASCCCPEVESEVRSGDSCCIEPGDSDAPGTSHEGTGGAGLRCPNSALVLHSQPGIAPPSRHLDVKGHMSALLPALTFHVGASSDSGAGSFRHLERTPGAGKIPTHLLVSQLLR